MNDLKTILATTMMIPVLGAGFAFAQEVEVDSVAEGKDIFGSIGCSECHTVEKGDASLKSGPNLYGLFLTQPRERKVVVQGKETSVKADRAYFDDSLRKSWDALAVAETGPMKGTAFQPLMPMYVKELISDDGLDSVWHYLRTLADDGQAGPAKVMVKRSKAPEPSNVLEIPGEEIVTDRTRVIRAPIGGTSARSLHVGQPNGMSYTFDPRMLSVRRVWTGGYLNLNEERSGRGGKLSNLSGGATTYISGNPVLQPLTSGGEPVDFEFKEPDAHDYAAIARHLRDGKDFADKLAALDAEFLGHSVSAETGNPTFRFRVGQNEFRQAISISDAGEIGLSLDGELKTEQRFRITGLANPTVGAGKLEEGIWSLSAGAKGPFTLTAKLPGGVVARPAVNASEDWSPQELVSTPAKPGRRPLEVPAGYSVKDWASPNDLLGRAQLFEPTGIAVATDGTIVLSTRTAGVWRIREGKWSLFAEGIYESLGVVIEDDKGDVIVIAQKPELTRIRDTDGDGRADDFETVCDDFGFHGNYHEYTHGPVRDAEGNYYFLLNLSHAQDENEASWKAGGKFMGSMGGYRGWACRVTPEGKFEPYAYGLRSPAGIGVAPDGRIWYAENQGEYVGSSKVVPLEQGKFYGHMSGLVDLPGMGPDAAGLNYDLWKDKLRKGAVWLPHGKMANSPGSPAWDLTNGKFGQYGGQMFIGDQTLSQVMRVVTEIVDGQDQGSVTPFARGLASGVMRPAFLPDGSLLLGQTGRGWGARGGSPAALQQVVFDGKTFAADISRVTSSPTGFTVHFTRPVADGVGEADLQKALQATSWFYTNLSDYGSPEHDKRDETVASVKLAADRSSVSLDLADFGKGDKWLDRIYHIRITPAAPLFGDAPAWGMLESYFTLRAIPKAD
ncbi:c-type cytochrome [Akkermansiaceae bacterium]|nr:c-type cytochrome [Akkermansiaceae bacterium]